MLFLLVVQQLETWKQTEALKWDLCLFPVQATEGQQGPASPSSPPTAAQEPWVRGHGPGAWLPGGLWRPSQGGEGQVEIIPNVPSSATPAESHQLCNLDQVPNCTLSSPHLHFLSVKWESKTFQCCCRDRTRWRWASSQHTVGAWYTPVFIAFSGLEY